MGHERRQDDNGFTLAELVVTTGVVMIALFSMAAVLWRTTGVAAAAESRTRAQAVATAELEAMRAIPWDALGYAPGTEPVVMPIAGDPLLVDGNLARVVAAETVTVGPDDFVVERFLVWEDASIAPGSDSYKRALVRVSWTGNGIQQSVEQDTTFLTSETQGGSGITSVFAPSPATGFAAVNDNDDVCQPVVTLTWTTPGAVDRPASWTIQRSVSPGNPDTWTVVVDGLLGDSETYPDANPPLGVATTYRIIGFSPGAGTSTFAETTITPAVVPCVPTTTTTTTTPGPTTSTTSTTIPTTTTTTAPTCVAVPQAASPSVVDRFANGANAGTLKSNVYVEVVVNAYCGSLWLQAEPQTGATLFEPMLATGSVAAEIIPKADEVWSLGNHDLRIVDSLSNVVATVSLTVTQ